MLRRFSVRTSGRVLSEVRRPRKRVAPVAPPAASVTPTSMTKDELVKLAEAKGVDTSGTKAEIAARLDD